MMSQDQSSSPIKVILILEDIRLVAETLREFLAHRLGAGHIVKVFTNLSALKEHGLVGHVLISDLNLPDSSENDTARYLLKNLSKIRIVSYSSSPEAGLRPEADSRGEIKYFCKSGSIEDLAAHIQGLL
jgi:DNA-binding NarL/FixJ family response regulator